MTKTLYTGTSAVTIEVDIAFTTTNPLTAAPTWTDVTQYVQGITIRRGRWTENTQRYDAGTASVQLNNSTRIFDPLYSAGTYFGQLIPMKQIRIRAVYSAVTYELFRGFVDGFPQGWNPDFPLYSTSTISCTDAFGYLSRVNIFDRYANEVMQDSPKGFWRCGDTDNQMTDSTANGNHGSWSGETSQQTSNLGPVLSDGAARLMATGGLLTDITFLNGRSTGQKFATLLGTDDITLEAWLYIPAGLVFTSNEPIGTIGYYAPGVDPGCTFMWGNGIDPGIVQVSAISATGADQKSYQVNIPTDIWFHLAATYVKNGALTVYINGKVVASGASGRSPTFFSVQPQAGIYIENQDESGDPFTNFSVDEVSLYGAALSSTRVLIHAVAGKTGVNLERSGNRVTSVLDTVGWPSGLRTLSSGDSWLAAGPTASTALDYLQQIADTEQGRFYAAGDGTFVFRDRTWELITTAAKTSQATFGDLGAELHHQKLVLDGGNIDSIINSVIVTPSAGTAGVAEDATSITSYGRHQEQISSLQPNQVDARNLAKWRLSKFKDPRLNFTEIEIHPRRDAANLFPKVLGLDFGQLITVKRRPQAIGSAISQDRAIDGIEHVITPEDWTTTFYLTQPAPTVAASNWWIIGDATFGKIGTFAVPY